jgi:hypothetical protein
MAAWNSCFAQGRLSLSRLLRHSAPQFLAQPPLMRGYLCVWQQPALLPPVAPKPMVHNWTWQTAIVPFLKREINFINVTKRGRQSSLARATARFIAPYRLPPSVANISDMAIPPDALPPIQGIPPSYRLIVKARTGRPKGYGWEIFHDDDEMRRPVSRSLGSYKTMEEAYTKGSVALDRLLASEWE